MCMKHPFWLINSGLLLFLLLMIVALVITRPAALRKITFIPDTDITLPKKEEPTKNLEIISENDLFGTTITKETAKQQPIKRTPMPQPPTPKMVPSSTPQPPKFLEPLSIVLKGIIIADDNIAIIEKNAQSQNYKVGDRIDDAQLIRILHNKVVLIRSNGQQETLYVSKIDAQEDQALLMNTNWNTIIKKISDTSFIIDPLGFTHYITSLAQFIDVLNLTTVFSKGKNIGIRVGRAPNNTLAYSLGLLPGDIILSINDRETTDINKRFQIYKDIIALPIGSTIRVVINRNNFMQTIEYSLQPLTEHTPTLTVKNNPIVTVERTNMPNVLENNIAQRHEKYSSVAHTLEKNTRYAMMNQASKGTHRTRNILQNSMSL